MVKDSLADLPTHVDQIGVMYMFAGAWVPDMHGTSQSADYTYHVGPHVMIITPHNEDLAKFNRDGSTGPSRSEGRFMYLEFSSSNSHSSGRRAGAL
jgi:hypothetical protein